MRASWADIEAAIVDPVDGSRLHRSADHHLESASGRRYRFIDDQPVLTPEDGFSSRGWAFPPIQLSDARSKPQPQRLSAFGRYFQKLLRRAAGGPGGGDRFLAELRERNHDRRPLVLIVGGASVGHGCERVVGAPDIATVAFDVYPTVNTTFVADGHCIPMADASVDGVWIQAVLEHVYDPHLVVSEIARVLRPGGLVYAETPFLQPVHEGAYDYARFTVSGHRLLFASFEEVAVGSLGGPGGAACLAIRGLVGGLARSAALARVAYTLTLPLGVLDRFVAPRWRADFATGAYFVGRLDGDPRLFDAVSVYDTIE